MRCAAVFPPARPVPLFPSTIRASKTLCRCTSSAYDWKVSLFLVPPPVIFSPYRKTAEDSILEHCLPEPNSGCWLWTGRLNKWGYGISDWRRHHVQHVQLAHMLSYLAFRGEVPSWMELDHKCRTRSCVNPDHLEPVTHEENMRRARGMKRFCKYGHELIEANRRRNKHGQITCRTCANLATKRCTAENREAYLARGREKYRLNPIPQLERCHKRYSNPEYRAKQLAHWTRRYGDPEYRERYLEKRRQIYHEAKKAGQFRIPAECRPS